MSEITLAIDCMGGDQGPSSIIEGLSNFLSSGKSDGNVKFLLFGVEEDVVPIIKQYGNLQGHIEFISAEQVVEMGDKPSLALRQKKSSSMYRSILALKEGRVNATISSGNTGALMAISTIILRPLEGVDRPAIAAMYPTFKERAVMLDLGANPDCSAKNLVQFAYMGEVYAKAVLGVEKPTIGILNIGAEIAKGNDAVKQAYSVLNSSVLSEQFKGFIEGKDIPFGVVDLVVTDGFSGNIALKTLEGAADLFITEAKNMIKTSFLAKIGAVLMMRSIKKLKAKIDPRLSNGAILLGLNGIVVKSHGSSDNVSFENAINVAYKLVKEDIISTMEREAILEKEI